MGPIWVPQPQMVTKISVAQSSSYSSISGDETLATGTLSEMTKMIDSMSIQWEFQDPKIEVLYHIRPYFVVIFPSMMDAL